MQDIITNQPTPTGSAPNSLAQPSEASPVSVSPNCSQTEFSRASVLVDCVDAEFEIPSALLIDLDEVARQIFLNCRFISVPSGTGDRIGIPGGPQKEEAQPSE